MPLNKIRLFLRARKELKAFLALPKASRKITFYSEDAHSMMHFEGLINALTKTHKESVCYLTSDPFDPVFQRNDPMVLPFFIGEGVVRTTAFYKLNADLCIMTMPDLETFHLKRSKAHSVHYLYLFHAMVSTHSNYRKGAFDHYDTIFCTGPQQVEEIRATERVYGLTPKNLYEDGYRRIEALIEEVKSYRADNGTTIESETKTIIVAPSWGKNAILEVCGEELVGHLLEAGYNTIVRPHPMTTKYNPLILQNLSASFGAHKRFKLQTDIRDKKTLFESHVMICDWSGVAMEYAFSCERPVIFIDVPKKLNNPEADRIGIEPIESSIRTKIGRIVSMESISSISESIEELYQDKSSFLDSIQKVRMDSVFNLGESLEKAAQKVVEIANKVN